MGIIFQESKIVCIDTVLWKFIFPLGNLHELAGNSLAILLSALAALTLVLALRLCRTSSAALSTCLVFQSLNWCLAISWINIRLLGTCHWFWSFGYTLQVFHFFSVVNVIGCIYSLLLPPEQHPIVPGVLCYVMQSSVFQEAYLISCLTSATPVSRMGLFIIFKCSNCCDWFRDRYRHKAQKMYEQTKQLHRRPMRSSKIKNYAST